MTAGLVAMQLYDEAAVERLNELGELARRRIQEAIVRTGIKACVTGAGSMFRVHFKEQPPVEYRSAYQDVEEAARVKFLVDYLYDHGFMMINTCSAVLSTPMTENEIDQLADTIETGFHILKKGSGAFFGV
jgi:glutamate-1-semialdehyde 2,1-aminomutase